MEGPDGVLRRNIAAVLACLALGAPGAPSAARAEEGGALTLERCVELALLRSPRLAGSNETVAAADARAAEARGRRLPVIDFGASYRYTTEVMERSIALGPFGSFDLAFGDHHQSDLNLGVMVPLFTGGELKRAADAAKTGVRVAGHQWGAVLLEVKRDVRRAFYAVLGRRAQLDAAELAVGRLERHAARVATAVETGSASEETRLRALAALRTAERRRLQAEAALTAAGIELGRLVGRTGAAVVPDGDLDASLLDGLDLARERLERRPELGALAEEVSRQRLLASAVRGRFLPRLSADLRAHYGRPGVDVLENDWMSYGTASVALSWTLWDDGVRRQQVRQAVSLARQAEDRWRDANDSFRAAYETAEAVLESARRELDQAREREDLEWRILELVGRRHAEAQASESEYLDAQDDLSGAEIERVMAQAQLRRAEADLLWILAY